MKRARAAEEFVEHRAERKDVARSRARFAARLFRRHVVPCASHHAEQARQAGSPSQAIAPRQSEIEQLDIPVGPHHHVFRLDVAVDDAAGVGRHECLRDLAAPADHLADRLWRSAVLAKRAAFHQFHGERGVRALPHQIVDGNDIGMIQCGGGLGLANQAVCGRHAAQEFQRHHPAQFQVARRIDLAHRPAAQQRRDGVAPDPAANARFERFEGAVFGGVADQFQRHRQNVRLTLRGLAREHFPLLSRVLQREFENRVGAPPHPDVSFILRCWRTHSDGCRRLVPLAIISNGGCAR